MDLIEQLIVPNNRHVKRDMMRERERINSSVGTLLQIEDEFIGNIFNNESESYGAIYKFYLAQFIDHCQYHSVRLKLKYYKINSYYFKDKFQPLELCKS